MTISLVGTTTERGEITLLEEVPIEDEKVGMAIFDAVSPMGRLHGVSFVGRITH